MNKRNVLLFILVLAVLTVGESILVHDIFTAHVLGGNDFYPRWAGARALLLEGRDPYDPGVTRDIAAVLDPSGRMEVSFSFAYPLHAVLLFWPLAYVSYDWAIAVWMVLAQWMAIGTVAVLLIKKQWRLSPLGLAAILVATLAFYPVARSILVGQFTLHVAFFVALTLLALRREAYGWAGIFFSIASVKPQMVLLVGPWLLIWAIRKRAFRFIWGLLGGGLGLLLASMALFPRWPLSFLQDLQRYSAEAGGQEPLALLNNLLLGGDVAWLQQGLALLLGTAVLYAWWQGWRGRMRFETVLYWSIVVNLLVPFQTGTTNQVLLLFPFLAWVQQAQARWNKWLVALSVALLQLAVWLFFLNTIDGNYESPLLFLPLPLLALLILTARELWPGRPAVQQAPAGEAGA